jgi:hypothetical protein
MTNPRLTHLLAEYASYDHLTLILAGVSLLAILLECVLIIYKAPAWLRTAYYCFLLFVFLFTLAGTTFLVIRGGTP